MNRISASLLAGLAVAALLPGCGTPPALAVFDAGSQVELRGYQSRTYPGTDREAALRAVVATLQDLGFVVDKADAALGLVTGTKLAGYEVRLTVTVQPQGQSSLVVRANAEGKGRHNSTAIALESAGPYQDFFAALNQSMFLARP